jgi:hypothetical protein
MTLSLERMTDTLPIGFAESESLDSGVDIRFPDNCPEGFDKGSIICEAQIAAISTRSLGTQLNIRLHD